MRVLYLSHMFPDQSNSQRGIFVFEQIKALIKLGVSVQVISPLPWVPRGFRHVERWKKYQGIPYKETILGVPVIRPRMVSLPGGRFFYLSGFVYYLACCRMARVMMRQQSFDLIHSHTIMPDGFASVLLGKKLNLPVICTIHGSDINIYPYRHPLILRATKRAIKQLDGCITVSQRLREKVMELCGPVPPEVKVIYNGADPNLFSPISKEEARRSLGISYGGDVLLYVGNLKEVKGVAYLVDAFDKVRNRQKEIRLYIVGEGRERNVLEQRVKRRLLSKNIVFIGRRSHREIPIWLSAADCLIMPSLSEGFPTLLSEAMLSEIPIVATSVGGIPELLLDSVNGLIVPPKNTDLLAKAIKLLIEDKDLARQLAYQGKQKAYPKFTWEYNAHRTLEFYQSIVKNYE